MKFRQLVLVLFICTPFMILAQFHTLKIPELSNKVVESQRLGVTDITISYHSPSINNRDVWNDPNIIPNNGRPFPWRAGANMNTTIEFSTDVSIEGEFLKSGVYGFHVIPRENNSYTLLFAHNHNLWGSYYLDIDKDVTLAIEVTGMKSNFSEKLDYEFYNWQENSVDIGLEWGEKRISFKVVVDMNKTVIESFRHELRGINTYRWQAWNDAANWCLKNNTNLEEALAWVNRSIEGGFGGFASNKNTTNLTVKANILKRLDRNNDAVNTLKEIIDLISTPNEAYNLTFLMLRFEQAEQAVEFSNMMLEKYPEVWFLHISKGISYYFMNDKEKAIDQLERSQSIVPDRFKPRLKKIVKEVKLGVYKLPND
ncbi:Protein of unknown function (DUF2911) [Aquimarina sp. MAR_2010_214]|uniref:DUF2911 domain-containing protein n=1 Tax=Aquimarina sp. MAR_2010_214 TaxID=1250026 RepID=UPI000C708AC2|nr:DUF2911 domain-containing protein [Aquimarina sp. MAR_2010_214]PKV51401.1 Protein of unknown function (DUF2911) [Aquimarina sp. MAR_2010_214]